VSITLILIPRRQILLQGRQLLQHVCNKHKLQRFVDQHRSQGLYAHATTATIVLVGMANASSTSSAMKAVPATTIGTTRRVSPSARTRASSSATYMASTSITCTTSTMLIHATKGANYNNKCKQQQKK
jgi:hypothetical protein